MLMRGRKQQDPEHPRWWISQGMRIRSRTRELITHDSLQLVFFALGHIKKKEGEAAAHSPRKHYLDRVITV